ncbi:uncharacterized protein LOC120657179 [Panicum virgatum]|uniref:uncharacterized protein LOC120657179 n=1 Tax=Panicum virgatum TaxID=38727 RepID=UPI0019D5265B|nr:uncharacterized protein LOC120657179 [Panicum virgatum]
MARRGGDEHRVPLGDITNTQNRSTAPKKRSRDLEDDVDLASVRRQKARERYASMPREKKAALNAKKRENYHRRQAEKRIAMTDTPQTGVPQSGVLCVHEDPCLMGTPQSAAFHIDGSAGMSCTPSSALLHVDGTTVSCITMGVTASEQDHVLRSQNTAALIDTPQSAVVQFDGIPCFMETPHTTGLSGNPPLSLLHVGGTAVSDKTTEVGSNATMQMPINRHGPDVLQNSPIADDFSDWLARNNSYFITARGSNMPAMLQGNAENTAVGAMVSPLEATKQKKRDRERMKFATMSNEKRIERNIKQRERYNSNKKDENVGKPNYDSGIWEPDHKKRRIWIAKSWMIVNLILMFSRMTKQESTILMMVSSGQSGNQKRLFWTVILTKEYTMIYLINILC